MTAAGLAQLQALQRPEGCFAAIVTSPRSRSVDCNGFVTASILRLLRHLPGPAWAELRDCGLDYVWSCRSSQVPGAFAFWPDHSRPDWASSVPADVDDTAIMLGELLRNGRLDRTVVMRSICTIIIPSRVSTGEAIMPSWIAPGCFLTWINRNSLIPPGAERSANVVDCCVNTNVVALMSQVKADHLPGYGDAVRTVLNGLQWAGADKTKLASLTPFYPSLQSLVDAIEHAVECGADALRGGLRRLTSLSAELLHADAGVCRSAYGQTVWHCQAVDLARAVARANGDGVSDLRSFAHSSAC